MKKGLLYFVVFSFIMICINPLFSSEFKVEDIKTELGNHFEQPPTGSKFTKKIESNSLLSTLCNDFFEECYLYIDYLVTHSKKSMEQIQYSFELYLISKGNEIPEFIEKPREELSIHDMKSTGVRFFFPVEVNKDGRIGTRICVSGEGLIDYENRNIILEAFTFYAIFNELRRKDGYILPLVEEYNELANQLKLSNNEEDLLKRAQGVLWALFYTNDTFEKILLNAYLDKEKYLPFKIIQ